MRKILLGAIMLLGSFAAGAQCYGSFTATANPTGNNLLNVDFTNTSAYSLPFTGQKNVVYGYYGDGGTFNNTSGTTIPSHIYAAPGVYTVSIVIISKDSVTNTIVCKDSVSIQDTVAYTPCGSQIFMTGFGATKTFSSFIPAGSSGVSYAWTFGDGGTSTSANPSHTYATAGPYLVTLTTTKGGCSYTNTKYIYVSIPPPALNCGTLFANYTSSVSGNVASFTNTSSTIASSQYYAVANWDYGDGASATGVNTPPHTYTAPGVYLVKLKMQWRDSFNTTSCRDSITKMVTITTIPTPANLIAGNVIYDTTYGTNFFSIYLIKYDSASNALAIIDSQLTASTSVPYYAFANYPSGNYQVRAEVWIGSTNGAGIIPTYLDSNSYWAGARNIIHNGGGSVGNNIYMHSGKVVGTDVGFIGGQIILDANTKVKNQLVYLRDRDMKIIGMTYTDTAGKYLFANLPMGYYSIYPELLNYTTVPVTPILLNANHPSFSDINFTKDVALRVISPNKLGITPGVQQNCAVVIAPNPAQHSISIVWNSKNTVNGGFVITTISGREVLRTQSIQGNAGEIKIDVSSLARGLYFVHGTGSVAGITTKLLLQ
ncbi:MAG: PKD domain-containing protein [Bacteroidetes bacterium]|nr:PKD domain-containing protein [Bacteroidota bacterium]